MKKTKKIMILILGLLLLMVFAVAPVIAAAATKVPVHGASISSGTGTSGEMWLTNGDITQLRGGKSHGGKLGLYIYPSTAAPDYVMTVNEEYDAMVNWKTGDGEWHFRETWEYIVDGQTLGTFKGEYIVKTTGAYITPSGIPVSWLHLEGHAVLQGEGLFEEQTLMVNFVRTRPAPGTFEGFLLTH